MTRVASKVSLGGAYCRGVAMGAADIVPGISGGTVALITGIYDRLLAAITAADSTAVSLLLRGQIKLLWQRLDGNFISALLAGICTAVLILANTIQWLLASQPLLLWSFFFGLVAASSVVLWRNECQVPTTLHAIMAVLGALLAVAVGLAPAYTLQPTNIGFFVAGALAICAMILPGISGSFILLLVGMYAPVISAVAQLDIPPLFLFAAGCVVGLLAFSRLLHTLLAAFRSVTMALLAGFLGGSLITLWPWREPIQILVDRHGVERVAQSLPVTPTYYAQTTGDSQWLVCLLMASIGLALVIVGHWWIDQTDGGGP